MLNSPDTKIGQALRPMVRRAVQAHPQWPEYQAALDLKIATMLTPHLIAACNCLDIDIAKLAQELGDDARDYDATPAPAPGTDELIDNLEEARMSYPDPRPHTSGELYDVLTQFHAVRNHASENAAKLFDAIVGTVTHKQDDRCTAKQMRTLQSIARQAKAKADKGRDGIPFPDKSTTPAPATVKDTFPMQLQTATTVQKAVDAMTLQTPAPASDPVQAALAVLAQAMAKPATPAIDEAKLVELIQAHSHRPARVDVYLHSTAPAPKVKEGVLVHYKFASIMAAVVAGVNLMLVGPAGAGKTKVCEQVAGTMGVPFAFSGAVDSPYKLSGFMDAQGRLVKTAFRRAYEEGWVFLMDEMDGSLPGALLWLNAALANGHADFPDGVVERHPNFRMIAACNTFGRGADRQYVGRLQLDAASLDRFAVLEFDYDTGLEAAIIGLDAPDDAPRHTKVSPVTNEDAAKVVAQEWFSTVAKYRRAVEQSKVRHIVSPRATIMGVKLLCAGWSRKDVEESVIWKGLTLDDRAKVKAAL